MEKALPAIPAKRYFTIGEVSELCGVKPYVLRYWEQEFTQLRPMKRRGNRRYYQHHEVLLVRRIRGLLYDQGFTISGARNRLAEAGFGARLTVAALADGADDIARESDEALGAPAHSPGADTADELRAQGSGTPAVPSNPAVAPAPVAGTTADSAAVPASSQATPTLAALRAELESISALLQA